MLAKQALAAALELAINQTIQLALNANEALAPLNGCRCILHIQELDETFTFQFLDKHVDVMDASMPNADELDELGSGECYISVSLFALPELKNTSQLTKLIKQDKLDLHGDLGVAQKFSYAFNAIEFDLEENLSKYLGDAGAYNVASTGKKFKADAIKKGQLFMSMIADAALDEKQIAVRPIMLMNFVDQVKTLKMDTERLEAKLSILESKRVNK